MSKVVDMVGKRYGRLVGVAEVGCDRHNKALWKFRCDCGNEVVTTGAHVRSGNTKSCGCLNKERRRARKLTHGMSGTKIYSVWRNMLDRCKNSKLSEYKNYGGRGIKVCERWDKFENFWEDMEEGYDDKLQIDRIDNNGDYEAANCRWVTRVEQQNNTRKNWNVTFEGVTKTVAQWARAFGIRRCTLSSRLRSGWSVKKALTAPICGREL